jgi:hypothetical protein
VIVSSFDWIHVRSGSMNHLKRKYVLFSIGSAVEVMFLSGSIVNLITRTTLGQVLGSDELLYESVLHHKNSRQ